MHPFEPGAGGNRQERLGFALEATGSLSRGLPVPQLDR
jgi:hypothetical protein